MGAERTVRTDETTRILIVSDRPAEIFRYKAMLAAPEGDQGGAMAEANSAEEALRLLREGEIAVAVVDARMPGRQRLAERVREDPRTERWALVFAGGGEIGEAERVRGYRSGAVDYVAEPVIPEELRARVGVFAELHRKRRELERLKEELEPRVDERTKELRQSEAVHRERAELLELASEAIIVRDLKGAIRYWNAGAETLYGWLREEVLGKDLHELLQTGFPSSREETQRELLARGTWQGNLTARSREGRELIVATHKVLNREGDAVLEIQRDITGQMQAEEALRQAEKLAAMGRVAGIIAHEINNPLEAITNAFYLLRHHPTLDDEARYYASLADQELQRVSHITRQTLSFYRESKQAVPLSIPELLDNVVDLQQRPIVLSGIRVEKKYASNTVVRGFPGEIRQIFLNLIGNAIQAMPQGGRLRLRVRDAVERETLRRGLMVSVIDTGGGIRPEEAKRLFQPFYTTKSAKGTGLGLWISKGIVQKYEGRIDFRSLRFRRGTYTCFRVFFPVGREGIGPDAAGDGEAVNGAARAIA